ncbi:MAG: hypothetical protein KC635_27630 [Myxococcales bacterium]|nr:hypothetical protein [Myxococcales bacterium]MCB9734864.1 hypothetical protein [Deltaproteobacteria bacterium]
MRNAWTLGSFVALVVSVSGMVACDAGWESAEAPADGTVEAAALLHFVNYGGTSARMMVVEAGLDQAVATRLVAFRNGADGLPRTKDDQPYRTVGEVGLVSGLEGGALAQVATWALDRGWDDALDAWLGVYDGVGFSLLDGEATLVVANEAAWETLDEAAGLRADAVDSIVRARPILSIDQLAGLPRVGPSNLDALRRYARMAQPVAAEPLAD